MKKTILTVILTAIICISGTVFAVTQINANQVSYTDKENNEVKLDTALDTLYDKSEALDEYKEKFDSIIIEYQAQSLSSTRIGRGQLHLTQMLNNYKYFKILSIAAGTGNENTQTCEIYGTISGVNNGPLVENQEYLISTYQALRIETISKTDNRSSSCLARVMFYN